MKVIPALRTVVAEPRRKPGTRGLSRALATVELATGAAAVVGGALLAAAPDGSLLRADPAVLAGTPFTDWRVPGLLLAALVGGGYLLTGWWQASNRPHACGLSIFAGAGLIAFEAAEIGWLGFQPLQAAFSIVGLTVIALAWRTGTGQS